MLQALEGNMKATWAAPQAHPIAQRRAEELLLALSMLTLANRRAQGWKTSGLQRKCSVPPCVFRWGTLTQQRRYPSDR